MKIVSKIRLLPVTIFAAALILTVKASDIFDGLKLADSPFHLSRASAQDQKSEEEKEPTGKDEKAQPTQKQETEEPKAKKGKPEDQASDEEKDEDNPDNDPTLFSEEEIDLLQKLSDRRAEIEGVSQQLNLREGLLKAAELRIEKRIAELKQLETTIQGLIKSHDDQQDAKMQSLVKIYEAMKPKDAARIMEQLDMNTLLIVAERMKERRLAPVMAQMNPEKAKDVTVELSKLRDLPLPGTVFVK